MVSLNNYINNVRTSIGNKLKEMLIDNTFNLFDIINYYISKNNSHLYTNINDINDLFNIITSNQHWITELDLYLLYLINEAPIVIAISKNMLGCASPQVPNIWLMLSII